MTHPVHPDLIRFRELLEHAERERRPSEQIVAYYKAFAWYNAAAATLQPADSTILTNLRRAYAKRLLLQAAKHFRTDDDLTVATLHIVVRFLEQEVELLRASDADVERALAELDTALTRVISEQIKFPAKE